MCSLSKSKRAQGRFFYVEFVEEKNLNREVLDECDLKLVDLGGITKKPALLAAGEEVMIHWDTDKGSPLECLVRILLI